MWPRFVIFSGLGLLCVSSTLAQTPQHSPEMSPLRLSHQLAAMPIERTPAVEHIPSLANSLSLVACPNDATHHTPMFSADYAVSFGDVLARFLCQSPALAQAMSAITEQAAQAELARLAFRPRFNAQFEARLSQSPGTAESFALQTRLLTGGIALNWVLFDFGLRDANLAQARSNLQAVMSSQSSTVLSQISEALRLYTEAQAAWIRLSSQTEALAVAEQSNAAASARYTAQVGSLAEKLQAQTALAQAQLERVRANSTWLATRASLSVALGGAVSQDIRLASAQEAFPAWSNAAPEQLLSRVTQEHPRVRSLQAEIRALQSRALAVSAEGKGNVSLSNSASLSQGLGGSSGRDHQLSANAAVLANIPLGNSAEIKTRQSQVQAQIQNRQAQVTAVQRELEVELWRSQQLLQAEQDNLLAIAQVLASAEQNYEVAQGRYKAGVGSMLELLSAQAARSNAILQRGNAQIGLSQAQLRLLLATGTLSGLSGLLRP